LRESRQRESERRVPYPTEDSSAKTDQDTKSKSYDGKRGNAREGEERGGSVGDRLELVGKEKRDSRRGAEDAEEGEEERDPSLRSG
jgi:hypothetical protein